MSTYEYGLIDAQFILMRNKSAQSGWSETGRIDKNSLLKTCLQSFMKLKRDYDFKYGILIWDKKPYHKEECLPNYKGDRWIPTDEEKSEWELILENPESTEEQKEEARNNIQYIENEMYNFSIMQDVKYTIVCDFNDMGFKSMIKEGYEADDLAYLTGLYLNNLGIKSILLTSDRDWVNFTQDNIDYVSIKNGTNYQELVDERNAYMDIPNITPYLYGILSEIYCGSHNNVPEYPHNIEFREFCTKLLNNDDSLPDYSERKAFFDGMNMNKYAQDVEKLIKFKLNDKSCNSGLMSKYMMDNLFSINFSTYSEYIKDYSEV